MYSLRAGHVLDVLRTLPDESVHCCITSPPYWGLRKYDGEQEQVWGGDADCRHEWGNAITQHKRGKVGGNSTLEGGLQERIETAQQGVFCLRCGAWRGALGLEPTPKLYVAHLVAVFREVWRVLRDDGTLWLNLGDSYASGKGTCYNPGGGDDSLGQVRKAAGVHPLDRGSITELRESGLKPKDLVGIPWRVAFALQADGWWLRSDIIWSKPNPMPESVTDRTTKAHEYIFLLAKSDHYYYDNMAVAEPVTDSTIARLSEPNLENQEGSWRVPGKTNGPMKAVGRGGRNAFRGQGHFRDGVNGPANRHGRDMRDVGAGNATRNRRSVWTVTTQPFKGAHFATWPEKLVEPMVKAGCPEGGTVLDPFCGSGTTGAVAVRLGRSFVGIDLSEKYIRELAEPRIRAEVRMI